MHDGGVAARSEVGCSPAPGGGSAASESKGGQKQAYERAHHLSDVRRSHRVPPFEGWLLGWRAMRAQDLMTSDVLTLPASATVAEASALVSEYEVRHVPIVGDNGALVGVLTDRDLQRVDGLLAHEVENREAAEHVLGARVTGLLGGVPPTCTPDTHVDALIDLFLSERLGAIVVTDPDAKVLGIVSVLDVLAAARGRLG